MCLSKKDHAVFRKEERKKKRILAYMYILISLYWTQKNESELFHILHIHDEPDTSGNKIM